MNKYQIVLTQVKTLVVEVDAKTSDDAVIIAKKAVSNQFDTRIGAVLVADARRIKDDDRT